MCSINHDLKAIFVHIPKCGGLFVEKILADFYDFETYYFTHENHNNFILPDDIFYIHEEKHDIPIDNNNLITEDTVNETQQKPAGFLRIKKHGIMKYFMSSKIHSEKLNMNMEKWNQYTKFTFIRNPYDKIVSAWKFINKVNYTTTTFEDFLKSKDTCNSYTYFHAFITQYDHLLNINNELNINFLGKFEELNDNLSNILLKLNGKIKHSRAIKTNRKKNSSGDSINYVGYYRDDLIKIVNKLFEIDFIKLGFKKCNNMDELIENSALYFVSDEMFVSNNKALLNKLILNDNLDISEKEQLLSNCDDKDIKKIGDNSEQINTLSINGLNINITEQNESAYKNIIHDTPARIPNQENIHFEGIMEMFRRASELTKSKKA